MGRLRTLDHRRKADIDPASPGSRDSGNFGRRGVTPTVVRGGNAGAPDRTIEMDFDNTKPPPPGSPIYGVFPFLLGKPDLFWRDPDAWADQEVPRILAEERAKAR